MSFCVPPEDDKSTFIEELYNANPDELKAGKALERLIDLSAENFTTRLQPFTIDWEIVYGITQYGSRELTIIRDGDEHPLIDEKLLNADALPLGLRKALAVETALHNENIERFGLEQVKSISNRYFPIYPEAMYCRKEQAQRFSANIAGRLWIRFLNFFDPIN